MDIPLCMPALIYLIYFVSHVLIDVYRAQYYLATIEIVIGILVTFLLNLLCTNELGIVSWLIVSIPFLLMTVASAMLLMAFSPPKSNNNALVDPYATPASGRVDFHGVQGKSIIPEPSNQAQEPTPMHSSTPQSAPPTSANPAPVTPSTTMNASPTPSSYSTPTSTSNIATPAPSSYSNSPVGVNNYAPASTTYSDLPTYAPLGGAATPSMIDKLDTCDVPKNGSCSSCASSVGKKGGQCMWCA